MVLLRLPEVLARTGYSRSSLYRRISAGLFPHPVKPSERISAWPLEEVDLILGYIVSGATDDKLRTVVNMIHENRKRV
jgi:prophage regulatory protein